VYFGGGGGGGGGAIYVGPVTASTPYAVTVGAGGAEVQVGRYFIFWCFSFSYWWSNRGINNLVLGGTGGAGSAGTLLFTGSAGGSGEQLSTNCGGDSFLAVEQEIRQVLLLLE
jgi:hypothetical protein